MPINFDDLNKDLHQELLPKGFSSAQVDEAMDGINVIVRSIKKDIIEFVKQINRSTMKAKDLDPHSDAFQIEVDKMQKALNGVMIYTGSLMPYESLKSWMVELRKNLGPDVK